MATAIPTAEDMRILCVECTKTAHVRFREVSGVSGEVLVALECCSRRLGTIHTDKFQRLEESGRKLTTNDVRALEAHRVINRATENIANDTTRLNWARWAMETK